LTDYGSKTSADRSLDSFSFIINYIQDQAAILENLDSKASRKIKQHRY
jgi:hypothetical protein